VLSKGNSIVTHHLAFTDDIHLSVLVQIWDWQVFLSSAGTHVHFQTRVQWRFHSWCEALHAPG
jgi:hypothetical protein